MDKFDFSKFEIQLADYEKGSDQQDDIQIRSIKMEKWVQKSTKKNVLRYSYSNSLKSDDSLFKKEIYIISTANHPAILPFIGYYIDGNDGYMFFELKDKKSLEQNIRYQNKSIQDQLLDNTHKLIILYGIACAMEFLHNQNVIYEELKPIKIFLDSNFNPFLSLFQIKKLTKTNPSIEGRVNVEELMHIAPETFKESKISQKSDVYSYGILMYKIFTGLNPFPNSFTIVDLADDVVVGQRPQIPSSIPEKLKKLMEKCWSINPFERPNFSEICDFFESDPIFEDNSVQKHTFEDYKNTLRQKRTH